MRGRVLMEIVCASRNPTSPHHASALQAERAGLLSDWIVALFDCWVDGLLGLCAVRLFGCCAVGLYGRVSVTIFNRKWIQMLPKSFQNGPKIVPGRASEAHRNQKVSKQSTKNEEQNILVSMIVFAPIFDRFWTDFGTQNRWKIDAQSDVKSSIERSGAQKR